MMYRIVGLVLFISLVAVTSLAIPTKSNNSEKLVLNPNQISTDTPAINIDEVQGKELVSH